MAHNKTQSQDEQQEEHTKSKGEEVGVGGREEEEGVAPCTFVKI
jgi:hypothetical protein